MRRPLLVWLMAAAYAALGLLIGALAVAVASGAITWDVKGKVLVGWRLLLFSGAVAGVSGLFLAAALGIWTPRRWARPLALACWGAAGGLALVTDRSVAGPGAPLRVYLIEMMLLPGAVAAVLVYLPASMRRWFNHKRRAADEK